MVYRILALVIFIFFSCDTTFSDGGETFQNTPKGNFDAFIYYLKRDYAYRFRTHENGRTIDAIARLERSRMEDSWKGLAITLRRIEYTHLRDPHVYMGKIPDFPELLEMELEYDRSLRRDNNEVKPYDGGRSVLEGSLFADIPDPTNYPKIGRIYVKSILVDTVGGFERVLNPAGNKFGEATDDLLAWLRARGVSKIILDVRSDAGGAVHNGKQIASRFIDGPRVFMLSEELTSDTSAKRRNIYIDSAGTDTYRNAPVVVLGNAMTCSGGEMFLLMVRQAKNFKGFIGNATAGCTGAIIDRDLPNAWSFRLPSGRTYEANGRDYWKRGIEPDIKIENSTSEDDILNRALVVLKAVAL